MIYRVSFDACSSTWQAFGRVAFFDSERFDEGLQAEALAAAQAEYPASKIEIRSIQESTPAARDAYRDRKERERRWNENNRNGIPNKRGDI